MHPHRGDVNPTKIGVKAGSRKLLLMYLFLAICQAIFVALVILVFLSVMLTTGASLAPCFFLKLLKQ